MPPAPGATRRPTQAERRAATRGRVVDAAAATMLHDGFAALTTRGVAQRAGVSQATVMHYFPSRVLLLEAAMTQLGLGLIDEVVALADGGPSELPVMLDELWRRFTAPEGLAIGQLWCAAWSDAELVGAVAEFERRTSAAMLEAMRRVVADGVLDDPLRAYVELVLASLKGLLLLAPITGVADADARWSSVRSGLLEAARTVT